MSKEVSFNNITYWYNTELDIPFKLASNEKGLIENCVRLTEKDFNLLLRTKKNLLDMLDDLEEVKYQNEIYDCYEV